MKSRRLSLAKIFHEWREAHGMENRARHQRRLIRISIRIIGGRVGKRRRLLRSLRIRILGEMCPIFFERSRASPTFNCDRKEKSNLVASFTAPIIKSWPALVYVEVYVKRAYVAYRPLYGWSMDVGWLSDVCAGTKGNPPPLLIVNGQNSLGWQRLLLWIFNNAD